MSILIREMEKKDITGVQDVAKKSWNATYAGIIPMSIQEKFLDSAYSDAMMQKRLEISALYVAEKDNRIIGFANFSLVKAGGEVELGAIYLLPQYQREGIGTALLLEGIKKSVGARAVFINVEKENEIGTAFYQAKGFQTVSEFDDDLDGHITKMVRMALTV